MQISHRSLFILLVCLPLFAAAKQARAVFGIGARVIDPNPPRVQYYIAKQQTGVEPATQFAKIPWADIGIVWHVIEY